MRLELPGPIRRRASSKPSTRSPSTAFAPDRLRAAHEPSPAREGRGDRAGRADEPGGGERAAEDARGTAAGHVSILVAEQPGRLAGDDSHRAAGGSRAATRRGKTRARGSSAQGVARAGPRTRASGRRAARGARARRCGACRPSAARGSRRWRPDTGCRPRTSRHASTRAGKDERRARLAWRIDWLLAWTADLARVAAGGSARQNPDAATRWRCSPQRVAPLPLFRYHRSLLRQRALLAHPLQPRLVAEALLIDYRALFALTMADRTRSSGAAPNGATWRPAARGRACCRSTFARKRRCTPPTCRSCAAAAFSFRRPASTSSARKSSCCSR